MVLDIRQAPAFRHWLSDLPDKRARERITKRLVRMRTGLLGDVRSVGGGVSEIRIDAGPGYRLYFTRRGTAIILLLLGGDKSTQARDIMVAQGLAREL